jgi:phosphate transport system substrate-binding protein
MKREYLGSKGTLEKENTMNRFRNGLMTIALAAVLCVIFMPVAGFAQANKIIVDGSTTVGPIAKAFAEYYMSKNPGVNITVSESGSGNGAKALINGLCDVADMSRFMKDEEFKAAVAKGVYPIATVVAIDGLAVVVHPSSPIQGLTTNQIRDIYTGKVTNWKALGGPNIPIVLISRDTNSGTYESFESLVLNKEKISDRAEYVGSSGAIRSRVQSTPAAIGYVGLGFVDKTVKVIKVNNVYPDNATVTSGLYPVARPLFMFTDGYPKMGSHLYSFLNLYLTQKGQEIIQEIGFVPVTKY